MDGREQFLAELEKQLARSLSPHLRDALAAAALPLHETGAALLADKAHEDALLSLLVARYQADKQDWEAFFLLLAALSRIVDYFYRLRVALHLDRGFSTSYAWGVVIEALTAAIVGFRGETKSVAAKLGRRTRRQLRLIARRDEPLLTEMISEENDVDADRGGFFDIRRDPTRIPSEPAADAADLGEAARFLDPYVKARVIDRADVSLLVDHWIRRKSAKEIAGALGVRTQSIRNRLVRLGKQIRNARKALRRREQKSKGKEES